MLVQSLNHGRISISIGIKHTSPQWKEANIKQWKKIDKNAKDSEWQWHMATWQHAWSSLNKWEKRIRNNSIRNDENLQCAKQYPRFYRHRGHTSWKGTLTLTLRTSGINGDTERWMFLQRSEGATTTQVGRKSSESREKDLSFFRASRDSFSEDVYLLSMLQDRLAGQTSDVCGRSSSLSRQ